MSLSPGFDEEDYRKWQVLVAMSNSQLAEVIRRYLVSNGIRQVKNVTTARSAGEALRDQARDALLVDYDLDPIGGPEFLKTVRRTRGLSARVRAMILVPNPDTKKVEQARDSGASEILAMPVAARTLFKRIEFMAKNPRRFIRSLAYVGPCRRRPRKIDYYGVERRLSQPPLLRDKNRKLAGQSYF